MFGRFVREDDGITAIEYGLIGVLITVAAAPAIQIMGEAIQNNLYDIIGAISNII
jgi:Flp pilus assembly pilin Flp